MTYLVDRSAIAVVVTAEQRLLGQLVKEHVADEAGDGRGFSLDAAPRVLADPAVVKGAVQAARAAHRHVVLVAVDPVGTQWPALCRELRAEDSRLGVVVITARPSYAFQRRWRASKDDDRSAASALLTFDNQQGDVADAIVAAAVDPRMTGFWPDGPRHPYAHRVTPDGAVAKEIRDDARYRTLLLVSQDIPPREVAAELGINDEQVGAHLKHLRQLVGVDHNVALGRRASELGLFDDPEPIRASRERSI